jgi:hypothetical protein
MRHQRDIIKQRAKQVHKIQILKYKFQNNASQTHKKRTLQFNDGFQLPLGIQRKKEQFEEFPVP